MSWIDEEKADVCSYAHDAIEQLLRENMQLKDENKELLTQINRLLLIVEQND